MPGVLVIMTRSTSDPRIKERLAPVVPSDDARRDLALAFLDDLAERGKALPGVRLRFAVTPPIEGLRVDRPLLPADTFIGQRGLSLAERQLHVFEDLAASGFSRVVMTSSSVPDLPREYLRTAFATLAESPATMVIGATDTGGCYLIAANVERRAVPDVFSSVRWDTPHAADDLAAACERAGRPARRLEPWNPVVAPSDLEGLATRLRVAPDTARHTAGVLKHLKLL